MAKKMKTYKREYTLAITLFWMAMGVWSVYADSENALSIFTTITIPVLSFGALAFGLDWKSKQA